MQESFEKWSSVAAVEACLARIVDPDGEGGRTFLTTWADDALAAASAQDDLRRIGYAVSPLAGLPVAVKDLFDVAGEVTRAGALATSDAPPAPKDSAVVRRLKAAGAVLVGRTNMTPFGYSVVGLNSHYGTPANPWDRTRTPGGSSSGSAVAVATGMARIGLGSDTAGSIRVPAALCGVVGFKPTQARVPREGVFPLAPTLDCIGPLARSVEDCASAFAAMSGEDEPCSVDRPARGLRLAVPRGPSLDGLDAVVGRSFEKACAVLSAAGASLTALHFPEIDEARASGANGIVQSVEALAWHERMLASRGDDYEPRIRARLEAGRDVSATTYAVTLRRRRDLMEALDRLMSPFDALLMPTTPVTAPTLAECEADEDGWRSTLLRNTAPINFLDRCAITLPMQPPAEAPAGLTLVGARNHDWPLLAAARTVEAVLRSGIE